MLSDSVSAYNLCSLVGLLRQLFKDVIFKSPLTRIDVNYCKFEIKTRVNRTYWGGTHHGFCVVFFRSRAEAYLARSHAPICRDASVFCLLRFTVQVTKDKVGKKERENVY